jgi:hypothetical protein
MTPIRSTTLALALVSLHAYAVLRPDRAAEHHEAGVVWHLQRSLDEASREYDQALRLDPPRTPSAEDRRRILSLAPRVFVTAEEPFRLKDAAAILHPERRVIAYHLFWDDDIDFPDDNDPSDHEVTWIQYDAAGAVVRVVTLFHGRLIAGSSAALVDAHGHGWRPRIDAQWGKHGPMPAGWRQISVATEESDTDTGIPAGLTVSLDDYNTRTWRKLSTEGTRGRDHPLAVRYGWPARFDGTLAAFTSFTREIDIRPLLENRSMMLISRWNSASLARQLLFYNFRPKLEWPDGM